MYTHREKHSAAERDRHLWLSLPCTAVVTLTLSLTLTVAGAMNREEAA